MDFSVSPEPITFKMEDDTFHCLADIPLDVLIDLADFASVPKGKEQVEKMLDLFDAVMPAEDAARLRERSKRGAAQPIGYRLVTKVLPWLLEVYGLRPTQPSSGSADGSDDTATSSTAGVSDEE